MDGYIDIYRFGIIILYLHYIYIHIYIYIYIFLYLYLSIYLSISIDLSIYLSIYLSICLSIYLSIAVKTMCPPGYDHSGLFANHAPDGSLT